MTNPSGSTYNSDAHLYDMVLVFSGMEVAVTEVTSRGICAGTLIGGDDSDLCEQGGVSEDRDSTGTMSASLDIGKLVEGNVWEVG